MNENPSAKRFVTIGEAAELLGMPKWKLSRAAKQGLIPTYQFFNERRLVSLPEVIAIIEATRTLCIVPSDHGQAIPDAD